MADEAEPMPGQTAEEIAEKIVATQWANSFAKADLARQIAAALRQRAEEAKAEGFRLGEASMRERASALCEIEALARQARAEDPLPGDLSINGEAAHATIHLSKSVTARRLGNAIRALDSTRTDGERSGA